MFRERKIKIYLDTSVISHLDQNDALEKKYETLKFWDKLKTERFDIYISDVTIEEINQCSSNQKKTNIC